MTDTPSTAVAVPAPKVLLIPSAIAFEVVKSPDRTFSTMKPDLLNGLSTIRSTDAPFGIRPAVGTPIVISSPAAFTSVPVDVNGPCASA